MDWKQFAPYLVPVLIVVLLARRVMRAQEPRKVRPERLWITPALLLFAVASTFANSPVPPAFVIGALVVATAAGAAFGWYRVHTLEFSLDPESGAIMSKATPLGAIVLVALIVFRYALKYFLNDEGVRGVELLWWTDGGLVFSAGMLVAQSAHTWVRAHKLRPAAVPSQVSGPEQ